MTNLKIKLIVKLNDYCFSEKHDDECGGCMFKNFKKCPLNAAVEKLERSLTAKGGNNIYE